MGIQIDNAAIKPAINYNRIHLTQLNIIQPIVSDDSTQPLFSIMISFRHYGVVDGVRYYLDEDLQSIEIKDYLTVAMTKAAGGDMTMITAFQAIEAVIASLIAAETGGVASIV